MRPRHDQILLVLTAALVILGLGMVFSASVRYEDGLHYLRLQLRNVAIGGVALFLVVRMDYLRTRRLARLLVVAACCSLVGLLFVEEIRGARNWARVMGQTVQPVEFARLAVVLFLAAEFSRPGAQPIAFVRGFLPRLAVVAGMVGLILYLNDFGSALALTLIAFPLFYVGGVRLRHLGATVAAMAALAAGFALQRPHVWDRIEAFLHPQRYAMGEAWQSLQSVLFLASGGPFGKGPGHGIGKFGYLPDPHTDFIFAVLGEELGFAGCALVLVLFLLLVARILRIARATEEGYGRLLAVGVAMSVFTYMAINVLVALRLFPVTGLPLPFISYGGSAMLSHLVGLGMVVNVARRLEPPRHAPSRWPARYRAALEGNL